MNWCGIEFRLPVANFYGLGSNFGWLCWTFADRTRESVHSVLTLYIFYLLDTEHRSYILVKRTNDRSQRTKYQHPLSSIAGS